MSRKLTFKSFCHLEGLVIQYFSFGPDNEHNPELHCRVRFQEWRPASEPCSRKQWTAVPSCHSNANNAGDVWGEAYKAKTYWVSALIILCSFQTPVD